MYTGPNEILVRRELKREGSRPAFLHQSTRFATLGHLSDYVVFTRFKAQTPSLSHV